MGEDSLHGNEVSAKQDYIGMPVGLEKICVLGGGKSQHAVLDPAKPSYPSAIVRLNSGQGIASLRLLEEGFSQTNSTVAEGVPGILPPRRQNLAQHTAVFISVVFE